ncbi:hypothetical protein PQX77_017317 [Marasmius sp. AFHP31]|nr:hypothetical protein PQX77_017317 [Marasmius sp. AFHP31]
MKFPAVLIVTLAGLARAQKDEYPVLLYEIPEGTSIDPFQRGWISGCTNYDGSAIVNIVNLAGDFDGNNENTQVRLSCVTAKSGDVTEELAERSGATRVPGDYPVLLYQIPKGTSIDPFQRGWVSGCSTNYDGSAIVNIVNLAGDFEGNNMNSEYSHQVVGPPLLVVDSHTSLPRRDAAQVRLSCVTAKSGDVTEELAERSGATRVQ